MGVVQGGDRLGNTEPTAVAAGVAGETVSRISAVDIVRAAVTELGGKGGGGRPDMAQGGGTSADNADAAITTVRKLLGDL